LGVTEVAYDIEETKKEVVVIKKGRPAVFMRFIFDGAFGLVPKKEQGEDDDGKRNL
jgi:hypothetical protein